jgi:1-acylglycerone phosphate reductase
VYATARDAKKMQKLAKEGIETIELDVADVSAIGRVAEFIAVKTGGKLDVLVNNA